jgi:CBS domain-containing protein
MPGHLTARDIMSSPVVTIPAESSIADAARTMIEKRIGCLVVVDASSGDMVGLVTERSFFPSQGGFGYTSGDLSQLAGTWLGDLEDLEETVRAARSRPVSEVMSTDRVAVHEGDGLGDVASLLVSDRIHHVAVLRGKKAVGVISRRDLLKVFAGRDGQDTA